MNKEIVEAGYDIIADEYNSNRLSRKGVVNEFFDSLSEFFPKRGKMLDIGCGGGEPVTGYFARKGYDVTGVDISGEMIRIAREQIPQGKFIQADMSECCFDNASFDLIVSTFAIIHIPQKEQEQLLQNIRGWLKPSGIAYLVLGARNEKEIVREWKGVRMYWSHFGPDKYRKIFKQIGLDIMWEEIEDFPNGERFYNVILKSSFHS
jgi:2-polyprenyl-3-methyl-5-hydroxy-6-metoxy-1,4-benzoquinol methylase